MDLNQIEHFLRVAELGSINRAAKELGLSQPALSAPARSWCHP